MPKYKCINKECPEFDKVISESRTRITIVNGLAIDKYSLCPECGKDREVVREPGMTTNIAGTNDQRNRMMMQ